jgi:phytoene dehydrogenase-like protein
MQEPRVDSQNGQGASDYDVVIVGAGLGGLVSGAILANYGCRVAVVDALQQPGARSCAVNYRGYWIDWGQRDAVNGIGDLVTMGNYHFEAARRAGIELNLTPSAYGENMRVHHLPAKTYTELPLAIMTRPPAGAAMIELYRNLVRIFSDTSAEEVDRVARNLQDLMGKLAAVSMEDSWALVPVRMGDWLERNCPDPATRLVFLNQLEASHVAPAEDGSVGRWIQQMKVGGFVEAQPEDDEVGASQAIIKPWVEAIRARGGDLFLGWKPHEIVVERRQVGAGRARVRGVVALNACHFVKELRAPVVVTDYFGWDLPKLLPRDVLPSDFLERAEQTRAFQGDVPGYFIATHRMPRIRDTGEVETFTGWQRVQFGTSGVKRYQGGFYWASGQHKCTAPEGKHLLQAMIAHHGVFQHWSDAKAAIQQTVDYLHHFYLDLEDCTEWSAFQYVPPPQANTWFLKPVYRHPVKVYTVDGLYCVASSAESFGGWLGDQVENALAATDMIRAEEGIIPGGPAA